MAQTFDIRFARSVGLAALFEAPANDFRWKGAGRLSIDASGISIAVKRGLLTLFARGRSRRIAPNSLIQVYREGNALRLEFSTQGSSRAVLPFWVNDRDAAAQIVTLLPTQRTVELEDDAGSPRKYRFDRRLVALALIGVVTLGAGALTLQSYLAKDRVMPVADVTAQPSARLTMPEAAVASSVSLNTAELPAPSMDTPAGSAASKNSPDETARITNAGSSAEIDPTVVQNIAQAVARRQFELIAAEINALHSDYLFERDSPSAERIEALEARWMQVTSRIINSGFASYALRERLLAMSRNWRDFLSIYAKGLNARDEKLIELAFAHLAFIERVEGLSPPL